MTGHDPLCPFSDTFGAPCMYCDLIAKVRAEQDDRECDHCTDLARLKIADLRAKVEDLFVLSLFSGDYVNRAEVLALFDGGE